MAMPLVDEIIGKFKQIAELYYRLMLVVAPAGAGKTTALQDVRDRTDAIRCVTFWWQSRTCLAIGKDDDMAATAGELREGLCLYQPGIKELGGDPADDGYCVFYAQFFEGVREVFGNLGWFTGYFSMLPPYNVNKSDRLSRKQKGRHTGLPLQAISTLAETMIKAYFHVPL